MTGADFVPRVMDLPIVRIETKDHAPVASEVDSVDATVTLNPNGGSKGWALTGVSAQIKGRGNSTWGLPKRSYKLKFASKTSVLGMPADKEWALLANYSDKTLLRNSVAFELSRRLGLAYTPRSAFVEVFLNGGYLGTYLACETIKIAPNRVNIDALAATDLSTDVISGGYLLEVDVRLGQPIHWFTQLLPFNLHAPDPIAPEQLAYIQKYVRDTETAIYGGNVDQAPGGYGDLIDVDSFVKWFLVNELFKNNDAAFFSSVWFYKPRNGKLGLGPVWDFDIAAGNISYNGNDDPSGWYIRNALWMQPLFSDPTFVSLVKARWTETKQSIDGLLGYIDQQAAQLAQAQDNNFRRWPILNQSVWPNSEVAGSYQGEIKFLQGWLRQRIAWMDVALPGIRSGTVGAAN